MLDKFGVDNDPNYLIEWYDYLEIEWLLAWIRWVIDLFQTRK